MVFGPVAAHGFDPNRSFRTTLSSIASARRRFSFALFARSLEPMAFTGSLFGLLQPLGVRQVHPAILGLELVERRGAQPVLPAKLGGRQTVLRYD